MKFNIFFLLIIILFPRCGKKQVQVQKITGKQIEINQAYSTDSSFIKLINPYKIKLEDEINRVLCYNPTT
ncbi:MAG: hypothetical protein L3J08_01325, partial [Flavobacteriaceae bacterium]|nr:hypothetical protein [Flavobacteriaceae bacterium]